MFKKSILLLLAVIMMAMQGKAQSSVPEFETLVKEYFDVIHYYDNINTAFDQIKAGVFNYQPEIADQIMPIINAAMTETMNEVPKLGVQIYSKYFTVDDMRQLINHNKSGVGKKMMDNTATMTKKSMELGQLFATDKQAFANALNYSIPEDYMQAIEELYKLSNGEAQFDMIKNYYSSQGHSSKFVDEMKSYGPLITATTYYDVMTLDDVKALNEYYRSPIGSKFAKNQLQIQQDMMEELTPLIMNKLQSIF